MPAFVTYQNVIETFFQFLNPLCEITPEVREISKNLTRLEWNVKGAELEFLVRSEDNVRDLVNLFNNLFPCGEVVVLANHLAPTKVIVKHSTF